MKNSLSSVSPRLSALAASVQLSLLMGYRFVAALLAPAREAERMCCCCVCCC